MLISEVFTSFQGEGFWLGTPSVFVRFYGCDVQCPFCDTPNAKMTGKANSIHRIVPVYELIEEVMSEANKLQIPFVTITGGEPLGQIEELIEFIVHLKKHNSKIQIQIETSGVGYKNECEKIADRTGLLSDIWITLSPKSHRDPNPILFKHANELKFLVSSKEEQVEWIRELSISASHSTKLSYQPLIEKNSCFEVCLDNCFKCACEFGGRVSLQTHKWVNWR
jgi:7-carboxy-7-deazaguanine synthase